MRRMVLARRETPTRGGQPVAFLERIATAADLLAELADGLRRELRRTSPHRAYLRYLVWSDSFEAYLSARATSDGEGFAAGFVRPLLGPPSNVILHLRGRRAVHIHKRLIGRAVREDVVQRGVGQQLKRRVAKPQPVSALRNLPQRFLAGGIQGLQRFGQARRHLLQERRLADTGGAGNSDANGRTRARREMLEKLRSENLMVRLQAMETIVETGLLDPELKPAIEALIPADPDERPYDGRMARYVMQLYED